MGEAAGEAICGEDMDDLSEDFRGLPLESMIGVDEVRATRGQGVGASEVGEVRGKGTAVAGWVRRESLAS